MFIRAAKINDVEAITQIVSRAYEPYISRIGKKPAPMLDDYRQVVVRHLVYVAVEEASVLGLLVMIEHERSCLLDNLAVDPSFHQRGIGFALLNFAHKLASVKGYDAIELYTHEKMHENIEYYHRQGYKITRKVSEYGYDRMYMEKELSPVIFKAAGFDDWRDVARLHAQSWQRAYQGLLDNDYLQHRVFAEKCQHWEQRFKNTDPQTFWVLLARYQTQLAGFSCVYLDDGPDKNSFLDNLHVDPEFQSMGLGQRMFKKSLHYSCLTRPSASFYLWVFSQNTRAVDFYLRMGGTIAEKETQCAPGGGKIEAVRIIWTDGVNNSDDRGNSMPPKLDTDA